MGLKRIIIFDGLCNLCESTVRFIIRWDHEARFRFASAQSEKGRALCEDHGIDLGELKTVVLLKDGGVYTRSEAFIEIMRELPGPWKILSLLKVIPRPLRDRTYTLIASHRYSWFGQKQECWTPPENVRSRFLG